MSTSYKAYFKELDTMILINYLKYTISGGMIFIKLMGYGRVSFTKLLSLYRISNHQD